MGTLTADTPRLDEHCPHKLPTSCRLTSTPLCCACADIRPHSHSYQVYIDGVGFVNRGTRWQSYCWFCKVFWDNRTAAENLVPPQTRIPQWPDSADFVERWFEFHQGYRVEKMEDGEERMVPIAHEPLASVAPGTLPRTLEEMDSEMGSGSRRRAFRSTRAAMPQLDATTVDGPSLDETLDQMLAEATAGEQTVLPSAPTPPPRPQPPSRVSSGMARLEERLSDARRQLEQAHVYRDSTALALEAAEAQVQAKRERMRRLEQERRRVENFTRVFGTREEVEQQGDDYVSPIGAMYNRAWTRYRQVEEQRVNGAHGSESTPTTTTHTPPAHPELRLWQNAVPGASVQHPIANPTRPSQSSSLPPLPGPSLHHLENLMAASHLGPPPVPAHLQTVPPPTHLPAPSTMSAPTSMAPLVSATPLTQVPSSTTSQIPPTQPAAPTTTTALSRETSSAFNRREVRSRMLSRYEETLSTPTGWNERHNTILMLMEDIVRLEDRTAHLMEATATNLAHRNQSHSPAQPSQYNHSSALAAFRERRLWASRPREPEPAKPVGLDIAVDERPEAKEEAELMVELGCRICYTQVADTACLPCGHLSMCTWCADQAVPVRENDRTIPRGGANCPVCRERVKKRVKIFVA